MSDLKFCKDCKWFGSGRETFERCLHPAIAKVNLVTGDMLVRFCEFARNGNVCGESGKLWEPKNG